MLLTSMVSECAFRHFCRDIAGVGHRVVHGGESLTASTLIDQRVKDLIKQSSALAPLHNPPNLSGIEVAQQLFAVPQVRFA